MKKKFKITSLVLALASMLATSKTQGMDWWERLCEDPGWMPIHHAAARGNNEEIRVQLAAGCPVDARAGSNDTPLHVAARKGQIDSVQLLLEHGADVRITGKQGYTAVHCACEFSTRLGDRSDHNDVKLACQIIPLLIAHGADPNAPDDNGRTPLQHARDLDLMQVLRNAGANPSVTDAHGRTLLHQAVAACDGGNTVHMLLALGINADARDHNGRNPLYCAAGWHVPALIAAGAQIDTRDARGNTPLIHALLDRAGGNRMGELIACGAEMDTTDADGLTALHHAAADAMPGAVDMLLEAGADLNPVDNQGQTPLHLGVITPIRRSMHDHSLWEARKRYIDVCRAQLKAGAHIPTIEEERAARWECR